MAGKIDYHAAKLGVQALTKLPDMSTDPWSVIATALPGIDMNEKTYLHVLERALVVFSARPWLRGRVWAAPPLAEPMAPPPGGPGEQKAGAAPGAGITRDEAVRKLSDLRARLAGVKTALSSGRTKQQGDAAELQRVQDLSNTIGSLLRGTMTQAEAADVKRIADEIARTTRFQHTQVAGVALQSEAVKAVIYAGALLDILTPPPEQVDQSREVKNIILKLVPDDNDAMRQHVGDFATALQHGDRAAIDAADVAVSGDVNPNIELQRELAEVIHAIAGTTTRQSSTDGDKAHKITGNMVGLAKGLPKDSPMRGLLGLVAVRAYRLYQSPTNLSAKDVLFRVLDDLHRVMANEYATAAEKRAAVDAIEQIGKIQ